MSSTEKTKPIQQPFGRLPITALCVHKNRLVVAQGNVLFREGDDGIMRPMMFEAEPDPKAGGKDHAAMMAGI